MEIVGLLDELNIEGKEEEGPLSKEEEMEGIDELIEKMDKVDIDKD